MDAAKVREIIGDPRRVAEEIRAFGEDSARLEERRSDFLERYPDQYIAFYRGEIHAHGENLDEVLRDIDAKKLPRGQTIIEVHANGRTGNVALIHVGR